VNTLANRTVTLCFVSLLAGPGAVGCDDGPSTKPQASRGDSSEDAASTAANSRYVLGSVSIDAEGNRISYAQIVDELSGDFTNAEGLEAQGNAVFMSRGKYFYYGLAESPVWVRYTTEDGFKESGRLSLLRYGIDYMDFANVIIDDKTAVSVLTEQYVAVVWNPTTMQITGEIDLTSLQMDGYTLEAFTTVVHDGLVYMPAKWVNWETLDVLQRVSMLVIDPKKLEVVSVAEDDRCGAGGRVTFDEDGYAYVMGDGRNQSMQEFAAAKGKKRVANCLLRIAPGETDFEEDYFFEIPSLTGGLDCMTELEAPSIDSQFAFTRLQYPDRIPEDVDRTMFEHWDVPAYKLWRIQLGDTPKAKEVEGAHFTVVGFSGSGVDGKYYTSESEDGSESTIFEIDAEENTSVEKFRMKGYFSGIYPIGN
jgi:hypothetical protein